MGKTFVIGDIHGAHIALEQCLERSGFDFENDTLIQLGDVADGWPYVYECVETLLKCNNLIAIKGNHDDWFRHWMLMGVHPTDWLQGANATAESYIRHAKKNCTELPIPEVFPHMGGYRTNLTHFHIPQPHYDFFKNQLNYYMDDKYNLFIHGGFNRHEKLNEQPHHIYWWDRDLWSQAMSFEATNKILNLGKFKMKDEYINEIFIGHTATTNWNDSSKKPIDYPMHAANIWNLDTGAGFRGKLTVMDVETKEFWQSDDVQAIYPDLKGRN